MVASNKGYFAYPNFNSFLNKPLYSIVAFGRRDGYMYVGRCVFLKNCFDDPIGALSAADLGKYSIHQMPFSIGKFYAITNFFYEVL